MWGKLHLICMKTECFPDKMRCNLNDISYLSETQKKTLSILIITTYFVLRTPKSFYYLFVKIDV